MADLSIKESTLQVSLVGANNLGEETNFVNSTENNEIRSCDILNNGGSDTTLSVGDAVPVEVYVSLSPRTARKTILIQPLTGNIWLGFSALTQSFKIYRDQIFSLSVGENTSIYIKSVAGTIDVAVGEAS